MRSNRKKNGLNLVMNWLHMPSFKPHWIAMGALQALCDNAFGIDPRGLESIELNWKRMQQRLLYWSPDYDAWRSENG